MKQRKHLVYIYCELNDILKPEIPELVRKKFYNLLGVLSMKKVSYYLYIFNYVCNRLGCEELQKYNVIKKQNNKWNQMLDKAWDILGGHAVFNVQKRSHVEKP